VIERIELHLRPGEDDDLIEFFSSLGRGRARTSAVIAALRGGIPRGSVVSMTIDEASILAELGRLVG